MKSNSVGKIIELLSNYPKDFKLVDEQNRPFIHILNAGTIDSEQIVRLSVVRPIGECNRTGSYVYPSLVEGYTAFCPELNEDLYDIEWTKLSKKK